MLKAVFQKIDFAKYAFWAALLFFAFLTGGYFSSQNWQPYKAFSDAFHSVKALIKESSRTRPWILIKHRYDGNGVTRYDADRAFDGYTLMQGWFTDGPEIRLVDMSGEIIHRWKADFFEVWPDPAHIIPDVNVPTGRFYYHIQGMWGLPDGSVVYNYANLGSVRQDACGKVVWTLDRMAHHSVTPNPDGSFWIPANGDIRNLPERHLLQGVTREELMAPSSAYEDRLLLVGSDGTVLQEISVLDALIEGRFDRNLYDALLINKTDPTHINDIEVVTPALAGKIDGVNPGDLLISIRQMHMLAILDRHTGKIKWHTTGQWIRQHDPDIDEQGNIVLFNNEDNYGHLADSDSETKGSSIVSLDPATGSSRVLYPANQGGHFHSAIQGTHQQLDNGNRLITESKAGRVFEIDGDGEIVWEYVAPYDAEYASMIAHAIRYDRSYFRTQDWKCTNRDAP